MGIWSPLRRLMPALMVSMILLSSCTETVPVSPKKTGTPGQLDALEGGGLFDSAEETRLRRDIILAADIAESLETISGIVEARVHLSTASRSILYRNSNQKSGAAVLVIRDNEQRPSQDEIRSFVAAAVPSIPPDAIAVFFSTRPVETDATAFVGPIEVARGSVVKARLLLGVLLCLCLVASTGLILAGLKLRTIRHRHNLDKGGRTGRLSAL